MKVNGIGKITKSPHELIIFGKVKRFSHSPMGNALRLVDGKAIWAGDDILQSFEGKTVCLQVKMVSKNAKNKAKSNQQETAGSNALIQQTH